ncbi:MAG TPA: hypothetical protein PLM07_01340 [Candidatus Rifleibacterium sp.]|nr:hypothetical protein [Candidatus Rifleibacterium sp.]HPT44521.1 hypothetical protein [Candidatus Rifleibacterium sp.]
MLKKIIIAFLFFSLVLPCFSATSGDLDGNGYVDFKDIAYFMGWFLKGGTTNKETVVSAASSLYSNAKGPIVRLPDPAYDNFAGENYVGMKDIAIMMASFLKGGSSDFGVVSAQAKSLYPSFESLYKLPGTPVGDSTVPVTITGIQVDP